MTPSEQCKSAGLRSLAELSRITGCSVQLLINWHRERPKLFDVVVAGAVAPIRIEAAYKQGQKDLMTITYQR